MVKITREYFLQRAKFATAIARYSPRLAEFPKFTVDAINRDSVPGFQRLCLPS